MLRPYHNHTSSLSLGKIGPQHVLLEYMCPQPSAETTDQNVSQNFPWKEKTQANEKNFASLIQKAKKLYVYSNITK